MRHTPDLAATRGERVHGERTVRSAVHDVGLDGLAKGKEEYGGPKRLHVAADQLPRPITQRCWLGLRILQVLHDGGYARTLVRPRPCHSGGRKHVSGRLGISVSRALLRAYMRRAH